MSEPSASIREPTTRAREAANLLFYANEGDALPDYEPSDLLAARAATQRLGELFDEQPGTIKTALNASRGSGELLSSDRLQGIAEIIQNADDVEASEVRFLLRPTELLVSHNGNPVRLPHVLGLATPWLSTKGGEVATNGRFGIGLMTLQSLSDVLEVHCHPYHVRLGDPFVSSIDPPTLPAGFDETGWTTLRVPLSEGIVEQAEMEAWLDRWDHSALLFLRNVARITLLGPEQDPVRELMLSRHDDGEPSPPMSGSALSVSRQLVEVDDGRSWLVYSGDFPTPAGVYRAQKATPLDTTIGIALPLHPVSFGQVHAGLPVIRTRLPLFANAQFDPRVDRGDVAATKWNEALLPLVAELWSASVLDLFARDPRAAWHIIPVPDASEGDTGSPLVQKLEVAVLTRARQWLSAHLSFHLPGEGEVQLPQLAVEAPSLEGILTESETASLAGLPATLPLSVRDGAGRWRVVLDDWRTAGVGIPEPVCVAQALTLLDDESRPIPSTIRLVSAAIDAGLNERLLGLPCVITRDGRHVVPPLGDSPESVAAKTSPLAEELGVVTLIHDEHLGDSVAAQNVLTWLRECGALLDSPDDSVVVHRLAAAGRAGSKVPKPLTDQQLKALRDAFELMDPIEWPKLGPDVGRAILLEAYEYDPKRRKKRQRAMGAHPADAYLPRAIDRETESFAVSADKTPGMIWLSDRYTKVLQSSLGRSGIGAQRFLRLLGGETAPRLSPHQKLRRRYAYEQRLGLPATIPDGPRARAHALQALGATYTLQDRECPALTAVVHDISRMRSGKQRRTRAGAVLATLARAWDRLYGDFTEVDSVEDSYVWRHKGRIPAYWLLEARDVAWLDDQSGRPRCPSELRVRTPGAVAIHGSDSPDYLHSDLAQQNLQAVLNALGVSGDPSRAEMITKLKALRAGAGDERGLTPDEIKQETAFVYRALAQSLERPVPTSDLDVTQLRREFARPPGLLFTNLGWQSSRNVFAGPPIFGRYKAFAPAIHGLGPLWDALELRKPTPGDCIEVIRAIARRRRIAPSPEEEAILLETLRVLAEQQSTGITSQDRRKLSELPLWTTNGWMRKRPVYATNDPVMAEGLRERLPLWEPGGDLEQFRSLLRPLRIQELRSEAAEVINPHLAAEDIEATNFFRSAVKQLQEDLVRNDPQLAQSVKVSWERLSKFTVSIHPSLALKVSIGRNGAVEDYPSNVAATVDIQQDTMILRERV